MILVSSWYTIRPAPMFRCPTSELPICPSGRPTARPLALPFTKGHSAISLSITGVFACATALPSTLSFSPYPSRIIKTVGFLLIFPFLLYIIMMMPELKNPGFFNHICFAFILHDFQVAVNSFDFLFSAKSSNKKPLVWQYQRFSVF